MTLLSAVVSAQPYIQVNRAYSGSGVDKTLTLTVRNISNKTMYIRNQSVYCHECSCINYKYMSSSGSVLYESTTVMEEENLTYIQPQSSKSFTFKIGSAARYPSNVNKNDIRTIQLRLGIRYIIPELNYSNFFSITDNEAF